MVMIHVPIHSQHSAENLAGTYGRQLILVSYTIIQVRVIRRQRSAGVIIVSRLMVAPPIVVGVTTCPAYSYAIISLERK